MGWRCEKVNGAFRTRPPTRKRPEESKKGCNARRQLPPSTVPAFLRVPKSSWKVSACDLVSQIFPAAFSSATESGPCERVIPGRWARQLPMKRSTHAVTRFSRETLEYRSRESRWSNDRVSTCEQISLASSTGSFRGRGTGLSQQWMPSWSQLGPFHHKS